MANGLKIEENEQSEDDEISMSDDYNYNCYDEG